jgi:hypothetical protein
MWQLFARSGIGSPNDKEVGSEVVRCLDGAGRGSGDGILEGNDNKY